MDVLMTMGMQHIGDRQMVACTWYLGVNLDAGAIHPFLPKMAKRQRTGIRPMAVGTQHADFGLRAKANHYLKRVRQIAKV